MPAPGRGGAAMAIAVVTVVIAMIVVGASASPVSHHNHSPHHVRPGHVATAAQSPIYGIYVDVQGINWGAQPPIPIVNAGPTNYTHIFCSFFLPSLNFSTDFAEVVTNPNPIYGGKLFVDEMHDSNKKVILTSGGATELPTSPSYFTQNDPKVLAERLADMVRTYNLDGIDIDWEDDWSNHNPGLTGYGDLSTRAAGSGPAIDWLVTLTRTLRILLPRDEGYVISHAPQAPYFVLGYDKVYEQAGDDIDYFNIQFYNQGDGTYSTFETLFIQEHIEPVNSCVPVWDGSVSDTVNTYGIPEEKIVVGKIIKPGDGADGYVPVDELQAILAQGRDVFPRLGGVFGWQWGSDITGRWIAELATAFDDGR